MASTKRTNPNVRLSVPRKHTSLPRFKNGKTRLAPGLKELQHNRPI